MDKPTRVLFVCLGNICRSPTAEGIFRALVSRRGLKHQFEIDSCGVGDWHIGRAPDNRAIMAARRHDIDLSGLRARQIVPEDLQNFDRVLVMDSQNLSDVMDLWRVHGGTRPELFLDYAPSASVREVPDPYYGGDDGFERVIELIYEASQGLLADLTGTQV